MIHMQHLAIPVRIETGPLQIGHDWPGVFLRGDEALSISNDLRMIAEHYGIPSEDGSILRGIINTLQACRVSHG